MNNTILKKMHFAVLIFYISILAFTISSLLFSFPVNLIKVCVLFMFAADIYFVATFYSSKREKTKLNTKSIKSWWNKVAFIIENLLILVPFFLTFLTLLMVFNVVSFNMIISKSVNTVNFFTYTYPNLFFLYIIRIGQFYYSFTKKYTSKLISSICSRTTLLLFILLTTTFFLVYNNFNSRVVSKVFTSQNAFIEELTYNASIYLSEYLEDSYSDTERNEIFSDFAATNNIKEIMLRVGTSLYKTADRDSFFNKHFIFDMLILKSDEFVLILPGKNFSNTIYITMLVFIAMSLFILLPVIILNAMLMQKMVVNPVNIIVEGFEVRNFNAAIDISDMEDNEVKNLSEGYNNIYLAQKYRDTCMIDITKRDIEDE